MTTKNSGKRSKNTGIEINENNYQEIRTAMRKYLILKIEEAAFKAGNRQKLSLLLKKSSAYIQAAIERGKTGNLTALERAWEVIKKSNS